MYYFLMDEKDSEKCICSQGPEGEYWAASFSDIPACVLSRLNLTAAKSSCNGSGMASCQSSQSGMMLEHSTASPGEDSLTLCAVGSHAPIYPMLETELELKVKNRDSGKKWPGSFARYCQHSRLWKTHQGLLLGGLEPFSGTWPRWGIMLDGESWRLEELEHRMSARECGCWLGTPTCTNMMGTIPTNQFSEGRLPSPAQMAHDAGGKPNPNWGEWLMGWPIGWTEQKPLAMDKFQVWCASHGLCFQDKDENQS